LKERSSESGIRPREFHERRSHYVIDSVTQHRVGEQVILLCLWMFRPSVPISLNQTDPCYNTVRQHIRNLSALCSLVLYLLDKLLLDSLRACNLQLTRDQRGISDERIHNMPLWCGVDTPSNLQLVGSTPSGCPLRRNTGLEKCKVYG
jgi:hypothetical protein